MWNLPPSKEGYWLACGYTNTSKQLYRKLPEMTALCEQSSIAASVFPTAVRWRGASDAAPNDSVDRRSSARHEWRPRATTLKRRFAALARGPHLF